MNVICKKCKGLFSNTAVVNGVRKNYQRRKYCFICSPTGMHNTRQLEKPVNKLRARHYAKLTVDEKKEYNRGTYKFQRANRHKRKKELVALFGGKCQSCGYNRNYAALQFHHTDPEQKLFILGNRNLLGGDWQKIINEAKKCKLLCANCHAEEHNPELNCLGSTSEIESESGNPQFPALPLSYIESI